MRNESSRFVGLPNPRHLPTCVSVGYLEGTVCESKNCTSWLSSCPISVGTGVSASVKVEKTRMWMSLLPPFTATS